MSTRKAEIERKSKETEIKAELNIDGTGHVLPPCPLPVSTRPVRRSLINPFLLGPF